MNSETNCQHRPACDGCPLFEYGDDAQTRAKLDRLTAAMRGYPELLEVPTELIRRADLGYRNRARMVARGGALGFYLAESRDLLPIKECLVHRPELEEALDVVRKHIRAAPMRELTTHVDARLGEEARVVTLVVTRSGDDVVGAARALAAELEGWGVSLSVTPESSAVVLTGEHLNIVEPAAALMKAGELTLEAPPEAFYQVNDEVLESVHEQMRAWMPADLPIVDAYCGVGTHGLVLSQGRAVSGFDENEPAIEAARRNATRNEIAARFDSLSDTELGDFVWPDGACVTIANPARAGVTPQFVEVLTNSPTTHLLYLSCEPETLARDLDRLRRRGFVAKEAAAFDMMPRTSQLETLVLLERGEAPKRGEEGAYDAEKRLPLGVSGPLFTGDATSSVWFGRVVGRAPNGAPPHVGDGTATINVRRLRNVGDHSIVRIEMEGADVAQLRQRMRRWGYPFLGDNDEGIAAVNTLAARREWLDRLVLHAAQIVTEKRTHEAPVPGELMRFLKLPDHLLKP